MKPLRLEVVDIPGLENIEFMSPNWTSLETLWGEGMTLVKECESKSRDPETAVRTLENVVRSDFPSRADRALHWTESLSPRLVLSSETERGRLATAKVKVG